MMRWGLVGCGEVANKKVLPSFAQIRGARIVGVASKTTEKAELTARQFGIERVYERFEEMLADPGIDAVYISTPPFLHHPQTLAALRAGKHVICEKPMALSVAQCREMVEEARSRNMRLAVAYYRRFWPQVRALKRLVEEGVAGRLMNARIQICGDVGREPAPVLEWKLKPELSGGGFLLDVGGHRIELLLYLFGNIEAVAAFTEPRNHPVDLGTGLLLRFAGGAFALASFNWTATYPRDEFEVMGTEATILALPLGGERLLLRGRGPEREIVTGCAAFTHAEMIQQTVDAIKRGEPLEAGGDLGLQVSAIIEAAYVAAKEGRIVSVNEVLEGMCATGR